MTRILRFGSPELEGNVALVALVLGYAANELGYRRLRSPEKRASHRKAADVERKDALALADLVVRLGLRTVSAWCSGCFSKTTHWQVQGADRPKRTYVCQECGTPTVKCGVPRLLAPRRDQGARPGHLVLLR